MNEVNLSFYVHKGIAYIPVAARTDAGFTLLVEPVEVADIEKRDQFFEGLRRSLARGNPVVQTPTRAEYGKPVVLKYARSRSWSSFQKDAYYWNLSLDSNGWKFGPWNRDKNGAWEEDPSRVLRFPSDTSPNKVLDSLIAAVQSSF